MQTHSACGRKPKQTSYTKCFNPLRSTNQVSSFAQIPTQRNQQNKIFTRYSLWNETRSSSIYAARPFGSCHYFQWHNTRVIIQTNAPLPPAITTDDFRTSHHETEPDRAYGLATSAVDTLRAAKLRDRNYDLINWNIHCAGSMVDTYKRFSLTLTTFN